MVDLHSKNKPGAGTETGERPVRMAGPLLRSPGPHGVPESKIDHDVSSLLAGIPQTQSRLGVARCLHLPLSLARKNVSALDRRRHAVSVQGAYDLASLGVTGELRAAEQHCAYGTSATSPIPGPSNATSVAALNPSSANPRRWHRHELSANQARGKWWIRPLPRSARSFSLAPRGGYILRSTWHTHWQSIRASQGCPTKTSTS